LMMIRRSRLGTISCCLSHLICHLCSAIPYMYPSHHSCGPFGCLPHPLLKWSQRFHICSVCSVQYTSPSHAGARHLSSAEGAVRFSALNLISHEVEHPGLGQGPFLLLATHGASFVDQCVPRRRSTEPKLLSERRRRTLSRAELVARGCVVLADHSRAFVPVAIRNSIPLHPTC